MIGKMSNSDFLRQIKSAVGLHRLRLIGMLAFHILLFLVVLYDILSNKKIPQFFVKLRCSVKICNICLQVQRADILLLT